jgi:hypothetical protein
MSTLNRKNKTQCQAGTYTPTVITRFIRVIQRNRDKPEKHWIARTEPGNDQFFDFTELQPEMQFCIHGGT